MFTVTLLTIAKRWKQPKCMLMDEWLKKICYIHMMGYHLAIKIKKFCHATIYMNLGYIMLSEISQSWKEKYGIIPLIRGIYSNQPHQSRKQKLEGRGNRELLLFNRHKVLIT